MRAVCQSVDRFLKVSCRWPICDINIKVGLRNYWPWNSLKLPTVYCSLAVLFHNVHNIVFWHKERSCLSRRLTHLGICYSCSIVSPTSFLPTSGIIGISQPSEMRRCSYFSTLMRTLIVRNINSNLVLSVKGGSYNRNITLAKLWEKSYWFCQRDMLMRIEIGFLSDKSH